MPETSPTQENQVAQVEPGTPAPVPSQAAQSGFRKGLFRTAREVVAPLVWVYILVKLFVFDADVYLINRFIPSADWLITFKPLVIMAILALTLLAIKSTNLLILLAFIIFYPVIVIFWRIPRSIYIRRSWSMGFFAINSALSAAVNFKYNFVSTSALAIVAAIGLTLSGRIWMSVSIVGIFGLLLLAYFRRFTAVFRPSQIFSAYREFVPKMREATTSACAPDPEYQGLALDLMTEPQRQKWIQNLQTLVLSNTLYIFIANRMSDYQKSKYNILSYIISILWLIVITVLSFSVVYFALYKVDHSLFRSPSIPSYFDFLYLSFTIFLKGGSANLAAIGPLSQAAAMAEGIFQLLLFSILISLVLSVRGSRYEREMEGVIKGLENDSSFLESYIREQYNVPSLSDAIALLEDAKSSLIGFIYTVVRHT